MLPPPLPLIDVEADVGADERDAREQRDDRKALAAARFVAEVASAEMVAPLQREVAALKREVLRMKRTLRELKPPEVRPSKTHATRSPALLNAMRVFAVIVAIVGALGALVVVSALLSDDSSEPPRRTNPRE